MSSSKITFVMCVLVSNSIIASLRGATEQRQFNTAHEAADALIQVAKNFDPAAAKVILGPDSEDIVSSEDPVADKKEAQIFAEKAKEKLSIEVDKKDPNRATISVGNDDFPLPIPLVKRNGKWSFDTKEGRREVR